MAETVLERRRWAPKQRSLERAWMAREQEELDAAEIVCRLYDEDDAASCRKIAAVVQERFDVALDYSVVNRLLTEGLRRRRELAAEAVTAGDAVL